MSDGKPKVRVTKGREHRKRNAYLLQIAPGEYWRMRRVDLMGLFFEGYMPTPLLRAVDRFQKMRVGIEQELALADVLGSLTPEDRSAFLELLRRTAVAATIEPKLTHSKRESLADEDLLWVGGISDVAADQVDGPPREEAGDVDTGALLIIWKAVLGEAGVVTLSDDAALEFRSDESQLDAAHVRDVVGIPSEAVVVDSHAASTPSAEKKSVRLDYH